MQNYSTNRSRSVLPALTGARFFAAAVVVIYHYGRTAIMPYSQIVARLASVGPAAVSFFYVLSGAVLTWSCTDEQGRPTGSNRKFWLSRAARILPAYLVALALSLLPFAAYCWHHNGVIGAAERITLGLGAALLMIQAFVPQLSAGLNTPAWSLSCEAFFYAVWPFIVFRIRGNRIRIAWRWAFLLLGLTWFMVTGGAMAICSDWLPVGPFATLLDDVPGNELLARTLAYFPPLRLPEFCLGIVVGHALRSQPIRVRSPVADTVREAVLLGVLTACVWLMSSVPSDASGHMPMIRRVVIETGVLSPIFALIVWQFSRGHGLIQRFLSQSLWVRLGEASYAIYILQEPIMVWMTALYRRATLKPIGPSLVFFGVYFALLVLASLLVYRGVEIRMRKRIVTWVAQRPKAWQ
jgi:peptidoglycan/LPS O-acetylase OafA/YrhL